MLTFTLLAFLLYPGNELVELHLGHGMTRMECAAALRRVETQIPQTMSIAVLVRAECQPERTV